MPPPFPFSSRFPSPFPSSVSFLALFFPFFFLSLSLVFVPAGPFSPPFEKALVFFSIVSQTFSPFDAGDVRMSDACSALPLLDPHFLFYSLSRYSLSIDFYHPKCSLILQIQALLFCVHAKTKCTRKSRFLVNLCSSFFLSLCPF